MDFRKIDPTTEEYKENRKQYATMETLKNLQIVVYVMVGGGLLGRSAAQQPAYFYIDARVSRLPYSKRAIMQAVAVLKAEAEILGFDPRGGGENALPCVGDFHNCGIF